MNTFYYISIHLLVLAISSFLGCKEVSFYSVFSLIAKNKFLHLLHASLVGHIILYFGFLTSLKFLGELSGSEFSAYNEKALSVITELIMMAGNISQELSLKQISSICLLYVFKSFGWTLDVKSRKQATKRMLFGSSFTIALAVVIYKYYYSCNSILSYMFCMEYSLFIISVLKNELIVFLDYKKVEHNRSLYIFIITLAYLLLKSLIFILFVYQQSKRTRFPYGTLKSFISCVLKFIKKLKLFKKYLKLVKDLNSIEEVEVDGSCAICTDDIVKGKKLACSHVFHSYCLKMWCEREVSCPICRSELVFKKEEIHETSEEIVLGIPITIEND